MPARRRLSRRAVKRAVRIGQVWLDPDGHAWVVRQIHRKDLRRDGTVQLEGAELARRYRTFGELGASYELLADHPARGP